MFASSCNNSQGGRVQQCAVVKVQQENRCIGRDRIDLIYRRQALLGKLVFGEATHDAYPLRWRGDRHLPLQHSHRIGERANTVPAQLHVEVQAASDDVQVVVYQTWEYVTSLQVDDAAFRPGGKWQEIFTPPDCGKLTVLDHDSTGHRIGRV
jgi:hypothetical protein